MVTRDLKEILAGHPFFHSFAPEHLEFIAGCAINAGFDEDQFLFREGEPADTFHVIRRGQVALEVQLPGRGALRIQTLREGDVLGASWLFSPYQWQFDARATTLVRTTAFDGACLRQKAEDDHDMGYELMKRFASRLVERLQETRLQLLDLYGSPAKPTV